MPEAHGAVVKYHYDDHDTDEVNEAPPVQNTWYTVFDAEDVRLLWCIVRQTHDEAGVKALEVRWTIDGTVYFVSVAAANNTDYYIQRNPFPSAGGTAGLWSGGSTALACLYTDKRGKSFKVEVRITDPVGTNQVLICDCVRETLDQT